MTYKTEPKTEYQPNQDNLKGIVENLYHGITGNKPDEQMKERLYAGMEGMLKLYEENPNAFYVMAAVSLLESAERYGMKSREAEIIIKYLAQSLIEESGYAPRDSNKKNIESILGGK
jgi:hypothetical protein